MCETTTFNEILEAKNGNKKTLNEIVEKNTKLIWSIVNRFQNSKYDREDLYQIGAIGLIKSIKRFDTDFNVQLSTFAVPYIIGEIKRFFRDDGRIKISRNLKELNLKIKILEKEYIKKGKELTIEMIEKDLNETNENIILAMEVDNSIKSLDEENQDENSILNRVKTESHEEETIRRIILKNEINKLSTKEKNIIQKRYFEGKTQKEVAEELKSSQVQISRIEKRILLKMRENIKER